MVRSGTEFLRRPGAKWSERKQAFYSAFGRVAAHLPVQCFGLIAKLTHVTKRQHLSLVIARQNVPVRAYRTGLGVVAVVITHRAGGAARAGLPASDGGKGPQAVLYVR